MSALVNQQQSEKPAFEPRLAKLLPPAPAEPVLIRPALDARLDEGRRRRLTVVVAGAGFGKSTTLARRAQGKAVAWYTTAADDVDPGVLGRGILAALSPHVPDIAPELVAALGGQRGQEAGSEALLAARAHASLLAEALERRLTDEVTLILDDVHELGAGSPGAALVEQLTREATTRLRLVLAGRSEPAFRFERLRGQGQVTEITPRDRVLKRFAVEGKNIDDFCLYGGWGIRVGYPSAKLLRSVSAKARARVSGRIVLALTANPFYSLDGVQPGTPLAAAARKLAVGHVFKVGGSEWYIASGAAANGILKVRHGIIQEIGIADGSITRGRKALSTFLASFRSS